MIKDTMEWNQLFFDESVTLNKVQAYRGKEEEESSAGGDHASETYAVMVEEVEKVSEILKQTQAMLWQSQDEVKTYNSKAKMLESDLEQKDYELQHFRRLYGEIREENYGLREEVERLSGEILDRDEGRARPELEKRLRKALEFLKRDLETATEKHKAALEETISQQKIIADLTQANKTLDETSQQLPLCQKQLREATEGNANLLEEVAKLRDELNRTKRIADQKDVIIRRDVEYNVKEKIKLEVSTTVTKQVTEKITRELTAKFKAERETELTALREHIKKIVKENAALNSKVDRAEKMESETHVMQQTIHALTYDLTRYESMIDEARQMHERRLVQLETDYRMKLQSVKEEAANDKWEHASEIRQQMTLEREREVEDFTRRMEDLSKQADGFLESAEKEKEKYGAYIRKRTIQEMQGEVKCLTEKLEARTKESDQLLRDAKKDKEAYAEQIRKTIEDEKRRETSKLAYRIEVLTGEKDSLEKRIESFEEEMAHVWGENENQIEQLKHAHSEIVRQKDENYKLHRKCQNLSTISNRYKLDSEEARRDLRDSKQRFREALLKSEELNLKLKAKLKESDPGVNVSRERFEDTLQTMEDAKKSLIDRMKQYETENTQLIEQNELLRKALDENNARGLKGKEPNEWCKAVEAANNRLKHKSESLASFLGDVIKQGVAPKNDLLQAMEAEDMQLKSIVDETRAMLRKCRKDIHQSSTTWKNDTECLKDQLQNTVQLLEQYCDHRTSVASELESVKHLTEEALTVSSDEYTEQSNVELHTLDRMLGEFNDNMTSSSSEIERLKLEVEELKSLLESPERSYSSNDTTTEKSGEMEPAVRNYYYETLRSELEEVQSDKSKLEDRVGDLNYIIEKYRNELSRASQDLENTRQTLVLEGETAKQLSRRVESLNNLLDTTEQKHSENSKQLAQSRRRFDDVANASKREIERLNRESKHLRELLKQTIQQSQHDNREHMVKIDAAKAEIRGWKSRVHALENEVRRHQDEFEKSKAIYEEALYRSEEEIVRLKTNVEVLVVANLNYVEESKTLGDLENALDMEKHHARKMDSLLHQAKDESETLLKRMEVSEGDFLRALRESEEERIDLKKSLDDVKKTLLGQSSEESSLDHSSSSRQSTRADGRHTAELHNALTIVSSASFEGSSDDSSVNVFSRFDDFVGKTKKQVSWRESDGDNTATLPSNLSHRHGQDRVHTETVPPAGLDIAHRGQNQSTAESNLKQTSASINGTSWEDSTIVSMDLESNSDSSRQSSNVNHVNTLPEDDKFLSGTRLAHQPQIEPKRSMKIKKSVSWNIRKDQTSERKVIRANDKSRDHQYKKPTKEQDDEEYREPVSGRGKRSTKDKRNDLGGAHFDSNEGKSEDNLRDAPFDSDQGLIDDDPREAPFNCDDLADDDLRKTPFDSDHGLADSDLCDSSFDFDHGLVDDDLRDAPFDSDQGPEDDNLREAPFDYDQYLAEDDPHEAPFDSDQGLAADHRREAPFDSYEDHVDDESTSTIDWNIIPAEDTNGILSGSERTNQDRDMSVDGQISRENVNPTVDLPSLAAASMSSSFSYSSNESSHSAGIIQDPENTRILSLKKEEKPPATATDALLKSAVPRRSRFHRARGKPLRRPVSKELMTQVLGDKKTGHHEKMLPVQMPGGQPFDEGVKKLSNDERVSTDVGKKSGSVPQIDDAIQSNE